MILIFFLLLNPVKSFFHCDIKCLSAVSSIYFSKPSGCYALNNKNICKLYLLWWTAAVRWWAFLLVCLHDVSEVFNLCFLQCCWCTPFLWVLFYFIWDALEVGLTSWCYGCICSDVINLQYIYIHKALLSSSFSSVIWLGNCYSYSL